MVFPPKKKHKKTGIEGEERRTFSEGSQVTGKVTDTNTPSATFTSSIMMFEVWNMLWVNGQRGVSSH